MATTFSDGDKIARARSVLVYFHNQALGYVSNYHFQNVDELVASIESFAPGFSKLYGQAVGYATDLSEAQIQDAMVTLADDVQGHPPGKPTDLTAFYDALSGKLINWDFSQWGSAIADATVTAVKEVGGLALGGAAIYAVGLLAVLYFSRK